jgi:hypothetical protein
MRSRDFIDERQRPERPAMSPADLEHLSGKISAVFYRVQNRWRFGRWFSTSLGNEIVQIKA